MPCHYRIVLDIRVSYRFNAVKLIQFKGKVVCNNLLCTCMVCCIAQRCPLLQVSMVLVSVSHNFSFTILTNMVRLKHFV